MGLRLFFLTNFPGAMFIQGATFIPDSRVIPFVLWQGKSNFWRNSSIKNFYQNNDNNWALVCFEGNLFQVNRPCKRRWSSTSVPIFGCKRSSHKSDWLGNFYMLYANHDFLREFIHFLMMLKVILQQFTKSPK